MVLLKSGIRVHGWPNFERDVMEILYVMSSDYMSFLGEEIEDYLFQFAYINYQSTNRRLKFLSAYVLGNMFTIKQKDCIDLTLLDDNFINC